MKNGPLRVVIHGDSMWPNFHDGDEVEFSALGDDELKVGDVVVAAHPLKPSVVVVKRISKLVPPDRLFLVGDNPDPTASEDSHNFGPVARSAVVAVLRT